MTATIQRTDAVACMTATIQRTASRSDRNSSGCVLSLRSARRSRLKCTTWGV